MFFENLDVFFNPAEFGSRATFTFPDRSTFGFTIIFDDAFLNPETGLISLETTDPQGTCKSSDITRLKAALAAINGGSSILPGQTTPLRTLACELEAAPGKFFSVLQVRPEGTGTATIIFANEVAAPVFEQGSAFSDAFQGAFGGGASPFSDGLNPGFGAP